MTSDERRRYIALIREQALPLEQLPPPTLPPRFAERLFTGVSPVVLTPAGTAAGVSPVGPDPAGTAAGHAGGSSVPMPGIKAVLFDVYGTLFSSAAGDINAGVEKIQSSAVNPGADAASRGLSTASAPDRTGSGLDALAREYTDSASGEELVSYFHKAVRESHAASKAAYPEVLAGEIWERFPGRKIPAEEFALRYELAVNPVYPMAGAKQLLASLKEAGFVMGIISNAQFYTPLLFEALLGGSPEALGFSPELLVYSYMEGEAKPSPLLFEKARAALKKQGIGGGETVYLGNDMRNDIQGAARAGFRTVLFAGDLRSLRLREDDPLISLLPCAVVSKLADFEQLLKRSPSSADNEKGA